MPVLEVLADVDHDAQLFVAKHKEDIGEWNEIGAAGLLAIKLFGVAVRITEHDRKLIPALVDIKLHINSAMEGLDEDTARHCGEGSCGEKLNEGFKLVAYDFLKLIQENWEEMISLAALMELGYICKSPQQVRNNAEKYITAVRSKIEAKVEKPQSATN